MRIQCHFRQKIGYVVVPSESMLQVKKTLKLMRNMIITIIISSDTADSEG